MALMTCSYSNCKHTSNRKSCAHILRLPLCMWFCHDYGLPIIGCGCHFKGSEHLFFLNHLNHIQHWYGCLSILQKRNSSFISFALINNNIIRRYFFALLILDCLNIYFKNTYMFFVHYYYYSVSIVLFPSRDHNDLTWLYKHVQTINMNFCEYSDKYCIKFGFSVCVQYFS